MDEWLDQLNQRRQERRDANLEVVVDGVTLRVKPGVAPEAAIRFEAGRVGLIRHSIAIVEANETNAELEKEGKPTVDLPEWPEELKDAPMLELIEDTAHAVLDQGSWAGWAQLRDPNAAVPLTFPDIFALLRGLINKASGFPTDAPADSSAGPTTTEPSSTEPSSSTAEESTG